MLLPACYITQRKPLISQHGLKHPKASAVLNIAVLVPTAGATHYLCSRHQPPHSSTLQTFLNLTLRLGYQTAAKAVRLPDKRQYILCFPAAAIPACTALAVTLPCGCCACKLLICMQLQDQPTLLHYAAANCCCVLLTTVSTVVLSHRLPVARRPMTMPTPTMCPRAPNARVSTAVKPDGSFVRRPAALGRSCSLKPASVPRLTVGARPNLPAARNAVVEAIMITLVGEPMKPASARHTNGLRETLAGLAAAFRPAARKVLDFRVAAIVLMRQKQVVTLCVNNKFA
eukprot:GHRR01004829.1.p1 GENE.GHRR01004829.1~~GHRR01004829.1.p1  ORF type:complete len:286 (+),score=55.44 GHRR01004829.1:1925-2782(+)